jgi:hypothetical protein
MVFDEDAELRHSLACKDSAKHVGWNSKLYETDVYVGALVSDVWIGTAVPEAIRPPLVAVKLTRDSLEQVVAWREWDAGAFKVTRAWGKVDKDEAMLEADAH